MPAMVLHALGSVNSFVSIQFFSGGKYLSFMGPTLRGGAPHARIEISRRSGCTLVRE
jgi:hypothetical protein